MEIGQRIKHARKLLNLTQSAFGLPLYVSPNYISRIEAGKETASRKLLRLIVFEYSVNEHWLMHGAGDVFSTSSRGKEAIPLEELTQTFRSIFVSAIKAQKCSQEALDWIAAQKYDLAIFTLGEQFAHLENIAASADVYLRDEHGDVNAGDSGA